ncbi:unnamed protein product [Arctia plantaginis]|uniref:Uncharacterized protein n=1 Tax=Arctia plantaginis TaxID=874455 RepID=A0A8S0ZHG0_ARCPL|nr:unnamed protein product [Arctia plantaginis]
MNETLCRLCLSRESLTPLFKNSELIDERSSNLFVTTGLTIKNNDGLPQHICEICTNTVDTALELRKRSYLSEQELLNRGYRRNHDPIIKEEDLIQEKTYKENKCNDFSEENESFTETKDESNTSDANIAETKWPTKRTVKKPSKKEQRQIYLNMVEGELGPKGPVTCKICKVTVSKWACFLSHAKLHLGFKFVYEFCGKSFISTTKLNRHCRSHHGMKKELKCKHCSYLALDNAQLKLHVRRMHTGERPYVCDICASSYHSRRCLVQHLESHRPVANVQMETELYQEKRMRYAGQKQQLNCTQQIKMSKGQE